MNPTLFLVLSSLGALSGFAASFVGVGGGILLFPLLLYFPPYLGLPPLDAKAAAALVISEVLFAGAVGGAAHWRRGRVHNRLTVIPARTTMSSAERYCATVASNRISPEGANSSSPRQRTSATGTHGRANSSTDTSPNPRALPPRAAPAVNSSCSRPAKARTSRSTLRARKLGR